MKQVEPYVVTSVASATILQLMVLIGRFLNDFTPLSIGISTSSLARYGLTYGNTIIIYSIGNNRNLKQLTSDVLKKPTFKLILFSSKEVKPMPMSTDEISSDDEIIEDGSSSAIMIFSSFLISTIESILIYIHIDRKIFVL